MYQTFSIDLRKCLFPPPLRHDGVCMRETGRLLNVVCEGSNCCGREDTGLGIFFDRWNERVLVLTSIVGKDEDNFNSFSPRTNHETNRERE